MTYWSMNAFISAGVGRFSMVKSLAVAARPSRRISLHMSTHSLQMCTDGPVMSLPTSCGPLPQNEHLTRGYRGLFDMLLAPRREDLVHHAVGLRLLGGHEEV